VDCPLFLARLLARTGIARFLPAAQRRTGGAGAFLRYYGDRALGAPCAELNAIGALVEPVGRDVIDLASGTPAFDLLPSGNTKLPADRRGPPPWQGTSELRGAVADRLAADGLTVNPAGEVHVTLGVSGAYNLVLDALTNPGDGVVLFDPSSPLYRLPLRPRKLRARWVPTWCEAGQTHFTQDALVRALRSARLIVLASPGNPTGCVFAPEDLERIAWWAHRRDVLIFNDEAFARYRPTAGAVTIGTQPKARRRTLTAGSVSKGHGLAAARVGWLAGHGHLVRPCATAAALQGALVPTLCQQLALTALQQPDATFQPLRNEFDARRHYVCERLTGLGLKPVWPAGGYFVWLPVRELGVSGQAFAEQLRTTRKALVWPGNHFGPGGADFVRISFGGEDGRLREGLSRVANLVRELQAEPALSQGRRAA